jgi:hypothetical protein
MKWAAGQLSRLSHARRHTRTHEKAHRLPGRGSLPVMVRTPRLPCGRHGDLCGAADAVHLFARL